MEVKQMFCARRKSWKADADRRGETEFLVQHPNEIHRDDQRIIKTEDQPMATEKSRYF